jgi:hypothetical protein
MESDKTLGEVFDFIKEEDRAVNTVALLNDSKYMIQDLSHKLYFIQVGILRYPHDKICFQTE